MTIDKITQAEKDKIFAKMINYIRHEIRYGEFNNENTLRNATETAGFILYEFIQDKVH